MLAHFTISRDAETRLRLGTVRAFMAAMPLAVAALLASAGAAHAVAQVIYPPDGTAVDKPEMKIIGTITERVEVVRLKVNGKLVMPFVGTSHAFEQLVRLTPGLNTIEAEGKTLRVHYTTLDQPRPSGFTPRFLHSAVSDGCDGCHDPKRPGVFSVKKSSRELCTGCHDDPGLGKEGAPLARTHSPIADDSDCLACHSPHVGVTTKILLKTVPDLCYECHDSAEKGGSRIHEPVSSGDCGACHSPHGSDLKAMLRRPSEQLCLDCHDDPAAGLPVLHEGTADGCLACHVAHASNHASLLATTQTAVCGECHDTPKPGSGIVIHGPIADDGQCTVCHQPHASKAPRLLKAQQPGLCLDCHDDPASSGKKGGLVHSPVADGACSDCHAPHSGPAALLRKKVPDLCLDCHDPFAKPEKGSIHSPVADGDCSACHQAHASPGRKLLNADWKALCLECHDAFARPQNGSLHDPVASGDCPLCHRPHTSSAPRLLVRAGSALCYDCHDRFKGEVLHSPVADEDCAGCHRPHQADSPKLLNAKGMALCLECHDNPAVEASGKEKGSIHSPIGDDKECSPCHTPHAGRKALLKAPVPGLCYDCHDDVTKKGGKALPQVHSPVADAACFDCHRPHASSSPALAVKDPRGALCLDCHDNPSLSAAGKTVVTPHPPVQEDCGKCHLAHAGNTASMLLTEKDSLCRECHAKHGHPLAARNGEMAQIPKDFPVDSQKRMRCGGCHVTHGSDQTDLWPAEKQAFCGRCHKIF